jgi:hypothetical protein
MIYERCLEERNAIIASQAFSPLELVSPAPDGAAINVGMNGTQILPAIPECDLEKELDNVRALSEYQLAFAQDLIEQLIVYG